MEIRFNNLDFINIEKVGKTYMIIADGTNGNTLVLVNINKRYLKRFIKDINIILGE